MIIKRDNLDENSTRILNEFHKNQVQSNICLHKFCLIIIIFLNIFLVIFSIIYKTQISKIKHTIFLKNSEVDNLQLNNETTEIGCDKKLVNKFSNGENGLWYFSDFFNDLEEIRFLKSNLVNLLSNSTKNSISIKMNLLYKGNYDGDNFNMVFEEWINHGFYENFLFLIRDKKGNRFGVITQNGLTLEDSFSYKEKKCFLYFIEERKMYDYIDKKDCIFPRDNKVIIGNNDIIINDGYYENGGNFSFPFTAFNVSDKNQKYFNEKNNEFQIDDIEFFNYYYVIRYNNGIMIP